MTLNSVAMIIAPNLFLVGTSAPVGNTGARRAPKRIRELLEVSTAAGISSVIRLAICYQHLLWQVSLSEVVLLLICFFIGFFGQKSLPTAKVLVLHFFRVFMMHNEVDLYVSCDVVMNWICPRH